MLKVVADSGAMASGEVGRLLESGELRGSGLIVPVAAIDELHAMAATGDSRAERGLAEIAGIQRGAAEAGTSIRVVGEGAPRGEGGVPDAAAVAAIVRRIVRRDAVHGQPRARAGRRGRRRAREEVPAARAGRRAVVFSLL